jgi:hypothetical protein
MAYPRVLSEQATLALLPHQSIARFGDGELRLALNGGCTSQRAHPKLAGELRDMLARPKGCLVGIPNAMVGPKVENWSRYAVDRFTALYKADEYASSFITRPDSAPSIDTLEYWADVEALWTDKDVTLVVGDRKSFTPEMMVTAASIREVWGPRQHAYDEIDRIEEEIGTPSGPVILCLGATATALAYRLARKGVHALDLGHLGMFMRHAGAYRFERDDLSSPAYRAQLNAMHAGRVWGNDGHKHASAVRAFADMIEPATILDYGCGGGTLAAAVPERRIQMYDPGVPGREGTPKPVDMIVCTDVLEHVEPDRLESVLAHITRLAGKAAYVVIATRPANAVLPDGRNAHLIVEKAAWWIDRFASHGWAIAEHADHKGRELVLWLTK